MDDYAAAICAEVARRRPALELWVEPGRSIAADTAILVTRVESEKTKCLRDQLGRMVAEDRWLLVDAGYNTFFDPVLYGWYYPLVSVSRPDAPADGSFRVAGPLCDGGDVYGGDDDTAYRRLPAATVPGDLLAFYDAGAYTLELMTPYNARPTAAAYAVTERRGGAAHPRPAVPRGSHRARRGRAARRLSQLADPRLRLPP